MTRHTFSLRQIEGFLLACDKNSFSKAADAMQISQSAFSQLIRELETSLGVRLFDRTTRRISMTSAGEAMHRKMRKGIDAFDEACQEARAIARIERGHITLGTLSSLATGIITRALGNLRKDFPGITVTLHEGSNGEIVSQVSRGELDLAVCAETENAPGLMFHRLCDDELAVVLPMDHRHARTRMLKWADLDKQSLVMPLRNSSTFEHISAEMTANNSAMDTEYVAASLFTCLSMVRAGFGLTFISRIVAEDLNMDGLVAVRVENPPVRRIGVYRQSDRGASPAALKFEEYVTAEVAQAQRRLRSAAK